VKLSLRGKESLTLVSFTLTSYVLLPQHRTHLRTSAPSHLSIPYKILPDILYSSLQHQAPHDQLSNKKLYLNNSTISTWPTLPTSTPPLPTTTSTWAVRCLPRTVATSCLHPRTVPTRIIKVSHDFFSLVSHLRSVIKLLLHGKTPNRIGVTSLRLVDSGTEKHSSPIIAWTQLQKPLPGLMKRSKTS
jgi:hypothetical protein